MQHAGRLGCSTAGCGSRPGNASSMPYYHICDCRSDMKRTCGTSWSGKLSTQKAVPRAHARPQKYPLLQTSPNIPRWRKPSPCKGGPAAKGHGSHHRRILALACRDSSGKAMPRCCWRRCSSRWHREVNAQRARWPVARRSVPPFRPAKVANTNEKWHRAHTPHVDPRRFCDRVLRHTKNATD